MNAKSSILIISGFWPTNKNAITGIFVVQQVRALVLRGFEVTVVLSKPIWKVAEKFLRPDELGLPVDKVTLTEIRILRLPEHLSHSVFSLRINAFFTGERISLCLRNVKRKTPHLDGCIIHGQRYAMWSLPLWKRKIDSPILCVLHGMDPLLKKLATRIKKNSLHWRVLRYSKKIVLVGSPLKKYAESLGFSEKYLTIIPNGFDADAVIRDSRITYCDRRVVKIVSVSNLVKLKGVDQNIRALGILADRYSDLEFEYDIIGDGPEKSTCVELANDLGLGDRVHFLGRLSHEETMVGVANSDIFSLPSWGEAFGVVYLEAMAHGLPVIGCWSNGAADIFQNGEQGFLIPPHDLEALANCLEYLIRDGRLRAEMGSKGMFCAEKFSWDENVSKIINLLQ